MLEQNGIEVAIEKSAAVTLVDQVQRFGLIRLQGGPTVFASMALASSAVPWSGCCAKAVAESVRTAAVAAAIMTGTKSWISSLLGDFLPVRTCAAGSVQHMPNTDARGTRVELRSVFRVLLCLPMASVLPSVKKAETSVYRRFMGSSQTSNALDRVRRLRFIGVIVDLNVQYRK